MVLRISARTRAICVLAPRSEMGVDSVVLIHGLWMNGVEMWWLRRRLRLRGYRVYSFRYYSLRHDLRANAERLQHYLQQRVAGERVHLVAHSLGGLMVRRLLHDFPVQRPGRVVTLGTPHNGSCVAAHIRDKGGWRHLLGRSLPALQGEVPPWCEGRELGSIGGTLSLGMGRLFKALPRPNDGTVLLHETQIEGMSDHLALPVSHFGMLFSAHVAREVDHFLQHGRFQHG